MSCPLILVVDDEPLITQMLGIVLELSVQAEVITTNSALEARAILMEGRISLLLTDYLMPDLNGLQLIRCLREKGNLLPAIILTGYCDEPELAANAEALAPFEVVVKPWNNDELMKRIQFWLRKNAT